MAHKLGENLKKLRGRFSGRQMADKIGMNEKTYSAYERGQNEPKIETLKRLADHHSITMDELCYGDPQEKI